MKPDLTNASTGVLAVSAVAFYVAIVTSSWLVFAAASVISLASVGLILRNSGPIAGHAPTLTPREGPAPGTVTLLDRDGIPHQSLHYHRIAAVQVVSTRGHVATCSKLPATPFPLRKAELALDGAPLHLQRRRTRCLDVLTDNGETLLTLERSELKGDRSSVRATGSSGDLVRDAPLEDWSAPGYQPAGPAGAVAQATVLAGVDEQLRPLIARLLSSV